MSVQLPITFPTQNQWFAQSTLTLKYKFDTIKSATLNKDSSLPISQGFAIPAATLTLGERSSSPSISFSVTSDTLTPFNLYQVHFINKQIVFGTTTSSEESYSFVIEAYQTTDVKTRLYIFIPLTSSTPANMDKPNYFNQLSNLINAPSSTYSTNTDNTETFNNIGLDLNMTVPSQNESFYSYIFKDANGNSNYITFFTSDQSNLLISGQDKASLSMFFVTNTANTAYANMPSGSDRAVSTQSLFKSTSGMSPTSNINPIVGDNIYIDCQPIDVPDSANQKTYLHFFQGKTTSGVMDASLSSIMTVMIVALVIWIVFKFSNIFRGGLDKDAASLVNAQAKVSSNFEDMLKTIQPLQV
jgi:hypothetical protein